MKKLAICLLLACSSMLVSAPTAQATNTAPAPVTTTMPTSPTPPPEVQRLLNRLEQIKAMDKSKLTREEKKALRKEVRATKKELKDVSGGVYISAGALILILILLIILT